MLRSFSSSLTCKNAFSMSVEIPTAWLRKRTSMEPMSDRNSGPTISQSLRLVKLGVWRQLQSYKILMGVVDDSFFTG